MPEPKVCARGNCPECRQPFDLVRWAEGSAHGTFDGWKLPAHRALGLLSLVNAQCRGAGAKLTVEWIEDGR